jgi:exosortase
VQIEKPLSEDGILEEFRIEFLKIWERIPNKLFFFLLLAAWLLLFQTLGNSTLGYIHTNSLFKWMYTSYLPDHLPGQDDSVVFTEDGHGIIVPFIVLGILWWKRKQLIAQPLRTWWPGLVLVALGLFLHLSGYVIQQSRVSIVGLFIGIYGLMGLAWGPAWLRATFFPFFLFAFMVPLGTLGLPITFRLRLIACQIVEAICHNALTIDIIRDGTALKDPANRYHYEVAAACSGIRSLIAILLLGIVYGSIAFRTWWKRGLMIASAFPLAVVGNVLRLLTIIIVAEIWGQGAGNWAHESTIISLLPYIPAFLGLMGLAHWLGEDPPSKNAETSAIQKPQPPTVLAGCQPTPTHARPLPP